MHMQMYIFIQNVYTCKYVHVQCIVSFDILKIILLFGYQMYVLKAADQGFK